MDWFTVDKAGLAQVLKRHGMEFVVRELWSNAVDQKVTRVDMRLTQEDKRSYTLEVEDDDPDGFKSLSDAWTLFAPSEKKDKAQLRGRFNLGEKLVLACCEWAEIVTTTGGVTFDATGRHKKRVTREAGSIFRGQIFLKKDEVEQINAVVKRLIVPRGVKATWNGAEMPHRQSLKLFSATLPTELSDEDGVIRRSERKTMVGVYEPLPGVPAAIYELGVPVVDTGDRYDVNIEQKVPLALDRESVPPSYIAKVRGAVLNAMAEALTKEEAAEKWVTEGAAAPTCQAAALKTMLDRRFGEKRAAWDPSDKESNPRAIERGYAVVAGGALPGAVWEKARAANLIPPAGSVAPSPQPYVAGGKPLDIIPPEKWSADTRYAVEYARAFAKHALGRDISVRVVREPKWGFDGTWGDELTVNFCAVAKHWEGHKPGDAEWEKYDAFLLHELGHNAGDHYSEAYYNEICRLGARLKTFAAPAK